MDMNSDLAADAQSQKGTLTFIGLGQSTAKYTHSPGPSVQKMPTRSLKSGRVRPKLFLNMAAPKSAEFDCEDRLVRSAPSSSKAISTLNLKVLETLAMMVGCTW